MGLTCRSCHHSHHRALGQDIALPCLWCGLHQRPAVERCEDFDREPGTDEQERKA